MKRATIFLILVLVSMACAAQTLTTANTGIRAEGSGRSGPPQAAGAEAFPTFDGEGIWGWNTVTHSFWCYDGSSWVDYGPSASGAIMPDGSVPFTGPFQLARYTALNLPTPSSGEAWFAYDLTNHSISIWTGSEWHYVIQEGSTNAEVINLYADAVHTPAMIVSYEDQWYKITATSGGDLKITDFAGVYGPRLYASGFSSMVATGTAPFTAISTTRCTNLNADKLDGEEGAYYAAASTSPAVSTGTTAPSSTPGKPGDIFVNTSGAVVYIATGSSSSTDWTCVANCP